MSNVANNLGEYSLGSLNDSTGWIPLDGTVADVAFNITGTFVGAISMQISNQSDYTKTRLSTITTYTSTQNPLNIPRELGRYVRFIMTAYTSGIAYVGFSKGVNGEGRLFDLRPQDNSDTPSGQFA
jgi:hypothetical protein